MGMEGVIKLSEDIKDSLNPFPAPSSAPNFSTVNLGNQRSGFYASTFDLYRPLPSEILTAENGGQRTGQGKGAEDPVSSVDTPSRE